MMSCGFSDLGFPVGAGGPRPPSAERAATARLGLRLALMALAMAFLALIGSYIVLRSGTARWPPEGVRLNLPLGWINTAVLAASSGALALALRRAREGRKEDARLFLQLGGALGAAFLGLQALQYYWLIQNFGQTIRSSAFGTVFYSLTGLHALHLLAGIGWLLPLALRGRAAPLSLELCATYWHFVTLVWALLFAILYLV